MFRRIAAKSLLCQALAFQLRRTPRADFDNVDGPSGSRYSLDFGLGVVRAQFLERGGTSIAGLRSKKLRGFSVTL